ncbi:unnamed protein product [Rodentolepis nana]|uniref:BLVR domain-containing protein n=1 Tax=Rodentolepis nana TaxID=102285 RepID=A0A0R3TS89_RODNA|nr:unnamed protein product [Rodentolepis nana]
MELAQLNHNRNGELLANQLLDVVVRVAAVRPFAVNQMAIFLRSCKSIIVHSNKASLYDVIYAAAWICGEYVGFLEEPQQILVAMLETANLPDLRGHIQSVLVLNSLKLYCKLAVKWLSECLKGCKIDTPELKVNTMKPSLSELQDLTKRLLELTNFLMDKISQFVHSAYLEVQERAVSIHQLLHLMAKRLSKFRVQSETPSSSQVASNETADLLGVNTEETLDPLEDLGVSDKLSDDHEADYSASSAAADSLLRGLYALTYELSLLFEGELNPVAPKAQRKVPVPEGLDLDAWINPPPQVNSNASSEGIFGSEKKSKKSKSNKESTLFPKSSDGGIFTGILAPEVPKSRKLTSAELEAMRRQRLLLQESNPHYLKTSKNSEPTPNLLSSEMLDTSKPPEPQPSSGRSAELNISMGALEARQLGYVCIGYSAAAEREKQNKADEIRASFLPHVIYLIDLIHSQAVYHVKISRNKGSKKAKKSKKHESHEPDLLEDVAIESPADVAVSTVLDLPEGVEPNELDSSDDGNEENSNDPHRLLNIPLEDLTPAPPPPPPPLSKKSNGRKRRPKTSVNSTKTEETVKTSISEEDFLKLLTSSTLTYSAKCKVKCPASIDVVNGLSALPIERVFEDLLNKLSTSCGISVIERVGITASLYSEFESNPVCLLIKLSTQTGSVSIEAKSALQSSADQLVQKLKPIVKAFRGND